MSSQKLGNSHGMPIVCLIISAICGVGGLLQRWYPTPKDLSQKARFAYTWKGEVEVAPLPASPPKIEKLNIIRSSYTKPNVTITEDDNSVVLDFEQFTITVQRKG